MERSSVKVNSENYKLRGAVALEVQNFTPLSYKPATHLLGGVYLGIGHFNSGQYDYTADYHSVKNL